MENEISVLSVSRIASTAEDLDSPVLASTAESLDSPVLTLKDLKDEFKELLEGRVFQGFYVEKTFVDSLKEYRDVILVRCVDGDLANTLPQFVRDILKTVKSFEAWIGFIYYDHEDADDQRVLPIGIMTELKDLPLGKYLFVIKEFVFDDRQIMLKIENVGELSTALGNAADPPAVALASTIFENAKVYFKRPLEALTKFKERVEHVFDKVHVANTWEKVMSIVVSVLLIATIVILFLPLCLLKLTLFLYQKVLIPFTEYLAVLIVILMGILLEHFKAAAPRVWRGHTST